MTDMSFPQVLLVGNGINRAFSDVSWKDILCKMADENGIDIRNSNLPMPLLAILATGGKVKNGIQKCNKDMYGSVTTEEHQKLLQKVLELGVDHILTTNYSYELESAALQKKCVTDHDLTKKMQTFMETSDIKRAESKYLLHTYNKVLWRGIENRIWHIHREARKSDSMILRHYYYGSLLFKYKELLDKRKNDYQRAQQSDRAYPISSWLDAFILGDVYILGFGFDLSELDLWWLLNRKKQEKAIKGTVYYFAPESAEEADKIKLLQSLGVKCNTLGFEVKKDSKGKDNDFYDQFYGKALDQISSMIAQK